jgi:hypothetical protein
MNGTLRLALVLSASFHLIALIAPAALAQSASVVANTNGPGAVAKTPLPLDVVLVTQRLYEPPATLHFAVVTPFDPDNREAGVELRCNAHAVASTIWTLDEKSAAVREFDWELNDGNCLYELVAVLTRTKDYIYLYQMVPSRAWLPFRIPARQSGKGRRF